MYVCIILHITDLGWRHSLQIVWIRGKAG